MNFSLNDPFILKESTRPYYDHIHTFLVQSDVNYAQKWWRQKKWKKIWKQPLSLFSNHSHFSHLRNYLHILYHSLRLDNYYDGASCRPLCVNVLGPIHHHWGYESPACVAAELHRDWAFTVLDFLFHSSGSPPTDDLWDSLVICKICLVVIENVRRRDPLQGCFQVREEGR